MRPTAVVVFVVDAVIVVADECIFPL